MDDLETTGESGRSKQPTFFTKFSLWNPRLNHFNFIKIVLLFLSILLGYSYPASATDYKTIELEPSYNHDKYKTQPRDIIREFRAYMTSFDSDDDDNGDGKPDLWGIPQWVAYEMKKFEGVLEKGPKRPSKWITDKELAEKGIAPTDATYRYSIAFRNSHPNWYDRGHLCMKQHAWRLGRNADWNTHTLLNAVPQRHNFNAGIWKDLEDKTAAWADKYGAVWIIAGPIIKNFKPSEFLGEKEKGELLIAIPDALFKIVIKESDNRNHPDVLAFIYPQEGNPKYNQKPFDHETYLTKVDQIENLTGLNFFTRFPKKNQGLFENVKAQNLWD